MSVNFKQDREFIKRCIAELSPENRKYLASLVRSKQGREHGSTITPRGSGAGPLPLSYAQQRLWFLDQLEPGSSSYNIPIAVQLTGDLDVKAMERTLGEIIRRHESLRTTFRIVDGQPQQCICPAPAFNLPVTDLRALTPDKRESNARRLIAEEAEQPFNLSVGPLLRIRLLRLDEDKHVLLVILHHIIIDGWSTGVLMREVGALYLAYSQGLESPLKELPLQYADYAIWQKEWLRGEVLQRQLSYWKEQLSDAPRTLELQTDYPRPARQSFIGARQHFVLPAGITDGLRRLSRSEGASLFMTLLAAFNVLLSHYSNTSDIVVGTPIANRNRRETEALIGFFVNTLVLRTKMRGDMSFSELVRRVRKSTLEAYEHQDVPFEKLVEELRPRRNMGRSPLFQVMFALHNEAGTVLNLPGLQLSLMESPNATAKYELTLDMFESGSTLDCILEYSAALFSSATIKQISLYFECLLETVLANPHCRLSELRSLTLSRRQSALD